MQFSGCNKNVLGVTLVLFVYMMIETCHFPVMSLGHLKVHSIVDVVNGRPK
jgi:hypothetical protein